jgi:glyceraldehyde 3-phosphate dehydrogenase
MAKIRVGINGFGRIGRNFFRAYLEQGHDFEIVAAHDLGDVKTMAHLLKHDSVLGTLDAPVEAGEGVIWVGTREIKKLSERDPDDLPWGELGIDLALESTGFFSRSARARRSTSTRARRRS